MAILKPYDWKPGFPVIDIALRDFLKQFNVNMRDRITFEKDTDD